MEPHQRIRHTFYHLLRKLLISIGLLIHFFVIIVNFNTYFRIHKSHFKDHLQINGSKIAKVVEMVEHCTGKCDTNLCLFCNWFGEWCFCAAVPIVVNLQWIIYWWIISNSLKILHFHCKITGYHLNGEIQLDIRRLLLWNTFSYSMPHLQALPFVPLPLDCV